MIDALHFPILAISQGTAVAHAAADTFVIASKQALENRYFDRMWVVDAGGTAFEIEGYEEVPEPFWKRPKAPFGRGIRLHNFVLKKLGTPTLDEVKGRILACTGQYAELWKARVGAEELLAKIQSASSIAELFPLL